MELLKLENISFAYDKKNILSDLNLSVNKGEFISLLGSSGCGKTTVLRLISGFLNPQKGNIFIDGQLQNGVLPNKRKVGMVFQDYALFPHLTVEQNLYYGLKIKKDFRKKKEQIHQLVLETARILGIENYLNRLPAELSGGQQQRVALGRSLVLKPEILLMDEPLSSLDANLRLRVREELKEIQQKLRITTVYVTHDQEEAMSISDHIILMKDGELQQIAKPQELYDNPANCFVADFLGNPPINKTYGVIKSGKIILDGECSIEDERFKNLEDRDDIILSLRAEAIEVCEDDGHNSGVIDEVYVMGKEVLAYITLGNNKVRAYIDSDESFKVGEKVSLKLKKRGVFVFDKMSGERIL